MQGMKSARGTASPLSVAAEGGRQPYFLVDIIEVKLEYMQQFVLAMSTRVLDLFESLGWRLISATYYLTGRPEVVMHVWQIPSADSLRDTMIKLSENADYLTLQEYIVGEEQHLLSRMMYDPSARPRERRVLSDLESALLAGATEAIGLRVAGAPPAYAAGAQPEAMASKISTGHMDVVEARTPGDRAAETLTRAAETLRRAAEAFSRGPAAAPRAYAAVAKREARPSMLSKISTGYMDMEEARTPGDRATDVLRRATEALGRRAAEAPRSYAAMERPRVSSPISSTGYTMKKKIDSATLKEDTSDAGDATGQGLLGAGPERGSGTGVPAPGLQLGPEDLVICADDGKFYVVSKETYMTTPLPENLEDLPRTLLDLGSVITTINPGVFPGSGSACYILNLPLIRKPQLP